MSNLYFNNKDFRLLCDKSMDHDVHLYTEEEIAKSYLAKNGVDPVRHGRWKSEALGSTSVCGTTVMFQCSECEKMSINKYRYCPNCGSRMDGETNGEME